ncbi:MAG: right-handed parallel beta-helix repeat-containing protein [Actinomycetota bacterium]
MSRSVARKGLAATIACLVALTLAPQAAVAHAERETEFPDGSGRVPKYRPLVSDPHLVVCKSDSRARILRIKDRELRTTNLRLLSECGFQHIQNAVDAVRQPGSTIYVLPGRYREDPYRAQPKCAAAFEDRQILSYEEQLTCPHAHNLIGVFGDRRPGDDERKCDAAVCKLQIEGTGDDPNDVLITGGFGKDKDWIKLNGIRADRADGIYLKNFTIELFEFNAVYILETDGFVIDDVVARYNDEYGFLTFAVDHGLYKNCEGFGNGDAGVYPGSASDVNKDSAETGRLKRWAVEIKGCRSHHNAIGYSGTASNSVYAHDNRFFKNGAGVTTDSVFPNHPGFPQDHAWFEDNLIYSNNVNYYEKYVYEGVCDRKPAERGYEKGVVCPTALVPVGTGLLIAGGSYNFLSDNFVYDNWRNGFMQFGVPAAVREDPDPSKQFDTSNFNFYVGNRMGVMPSGKTALNGLDFWWDDQGEGNCWDKNRGAGENGVTSNTFYPGGLPTCDGGGSSWIPANAVKQGPLVPCATYDRSDPIFRNPPGCNWSDSPSKP